MIDPRSSLITPALKDQTVLREFKESKNLPNPSVGNLYLIKTLLTIAEYRELF